MAFKLFLFVVLVAAAVFFEEANGHGMMLDPAGRSSVWRFVPGAPPNYNDNQLYCGGGVIPENGKCGVCGDAYGQAHPQENENTGKYGRGIIMRNYTSGSVIETSVLLTTNHKGTFEYSLCVLSNPNTFEQEQCFVGLTLEDGTKKFQVPAGVKEFKNRVRLPAGVKCNRCVLRWNYRAGNQWGQCGDGTSGQGCGPQETFRSCADISIL